MSRENKIRISIAIVLAAIVILSLGVWIRQLNQELALREATHAEMATQLAENTETMNQLKVDVNTLDEKNVIISQENAALLLEQERATNLLESQIKLMQRDDWDFLIRLYTVGPESIERRIGGYAPGFVGEEKLEMNLKIIAYYLQEYFFNGLPITYGGMEIVEGKNVALIHLEEDERNTMSWKGQYFQGSLGALETETRLIDSFLQPQLQQPWIDGVRFVYEGGQDFVGHVETLMSGVIWRSIEIPFETETTEVLPVKDGEKVVYRSVTAGLQMTADRAYADSGLKVRVGLFNRLVIYYEFPNGEWYDFGAYILTDDRGIIYDMTLDVGFHDMENFIYYDELKKENIKTKYGIEVETLE